MAQYHLEDDAKERISLLIKERIPWLIVGLLGGLVASILVSRYEDILTANIPLAFFLPVIVYMSDAIGTQTGTVYVRNMAKFKDNFFKYLAKEVLIGLSFGSIFGILLGIFAGFWIGSGQIALSVGLAMFITATIAPVIALIIPEVLSKGKIDPALGGGPFTTVIQDLISLLIYFSVAAVIIL